MFPPLYKGGVRGVKFGRIPYKVVLFLLLTFYPSLGTAANMALDEIVSKLQKNYQTMRDYRANFSQETKIKAYPRSQKSSGEVFYKKPGRMRWNYEKPEKREIVTDGKTLWMYTPSLNQVMKADFSMTNQSRTAQAFLSGMGNLKEDFNIAFDNEAGEGADYRLILTPKDEAEALKSLVITVDSSNFNIKRSEMTDLYDNVTIVTFNGLKMNSGLDDSIFDFKMPEGVEIVTPPKTY